MNSYHYYYQCIHTNNDIIDILSKFLLMSYHHYYCESRGSFVSSQIHNSNNDISEVINSTLSSIWGQATQLIGGDRS